MVFTGPHCHSCHADLHLCCSTSYGITNSWMRPFDGRVPDPAGIRSVLLDNYIIVMSNVVVKILLNISYTNWSIPCRLDNGSNSIITLFVA